MEVGGQIIARLVDSSGKRDSIEGSPGVSSSQREGGQVARANLRQDNGISCLGGFRGGWECLTVLRGGERSVVSDETLVDRLVAGQKTNFVREHVSSSLRLSEIRRYFDDF